MAATGTPELRRDRSMPGEVGYGMRLVVRAQRYQFAVCCINDWNLVCTTNCVLRNA
jgi:hypothetical protein